MQLKDLLSVIQQVAEDNSIRIPYIVGGIPRDLLLGRLYNLNDIDLTNGEKSIDRLADLVAERLGVEAKIFIDGHKKLRFDRFSVDFSTNQMYGNIDELLASQKIKSLNDMVRETYSRDFTINTLMVPFDFSRVIDLTAHGRADITNKIIRCPVNPIVALRESPNRIIRAFYYAAKYNFELDGELKKAIANNLNLLDNVKAKYASDKIAAAIKEKPEIVNDLIELGVLHKIRLTKEITEQLIKARRLADVI